MILRWFVPLFLFIPHALYSIRRCICFRLFSASLFLTFLSFAIATSINHSCSFFIITVYYVQFIVKESFCGFALVKGKGKDKFRCRTVYVDLNGEWRYNCTLSLTLALVEGGWLTPRHSRFTRGNNSIPIV